MKKAVGWIVALALVALGIWYFAFRTPQTGAPAAALSDQTAATSTSGATALPQPETVTVTYTDSGFSPKSVTITTGQAVTFVNQGSGKMWIASDNHPSHTLYDGTSKAQHCVNGAPDAADVFDECQAVGAGESFTFTFGKAGTWKYHNHVSAGDTGSVVVTAASSDTTISASTTLNVEVR